MVYIEKKYRFFFDLFMRGSIAPFYGKDVRNKLTDEIICSGEENELHNFNNFNISTVWDIPEYLEVTQKNLNPKIKVTKIKQYTGFLIDLSTFAKPDEFLNVQLSSRNRKKLRSKIRKLETEHKIRYSFYHGFIDKEEYDRLFLELYNLLEHRFEEKKMLNNNLGKWDYYQEIVYPLILEKRASLFVIYDGNKPITIALQFHLAHTVFSYIQCYDIAYSQYNMGDISMAKRLEWCFENGFNVLDLSMGETDYKLKWCNHQYNLYFHLFYNSKSISAQYRKNLILGKLKFKQYLRDKEILGKLIRLDKIKYQIKKLTT